MGGGKKKGNVITNLGNWANKTFAGNSGKSNFMKSVEDAANNVNVQTLTQTEFDSLLQKSAIQGQEGTEADSLLRQEKLLGTRKISRRTGVVDKEKAKSLFEAIRKREMELSNSKKFAIGSQTGMRRAL